LGIVLGLAVGAADVTPPLSGTALLKTDVLGVFAHPDDETGVSALMADLSLRQGKRVSHVYCTRGEGGGNMVGTHFGPSLGVLREAELRDCLARIGVRFVYFLDRADFAYTESLQVTLEKWGHEETLGRLVRLIRALRPEVIVTMNPAPTAGQHGNHQAAGWLATEAFDAAADATVFPEQISLEGLHVWQPRKLYFSGTGPFTATLSVTNPLPDGRIPAQIAGQAAAQHRSQGFGNFASSPWFIRPARWQLVKSVVPFVTDEPDLFRGLPLAGDPETARRMKAPTTGNQALENSFFQPRPAVARYRQFVRANGIQHAAASLAVDVPVVAGATNILSVVPLPGVELASLSFDWPAGWKASAGHDSLTVVVPSGANGDFDLTCSIPAASPSAVGLMSARLHVVPRAVLPRTGLLGPLVREASWPVTTTRLAISHTNLWEGKTRNGADSSAVVQLAQDGTQLWVELQVTDDTVVSNIAPDDIRGHWRSDSVELCVDPQPGSEHTLGAYKLGIFPFDLTGRVRAARDADARPGLVEDTAPGTRLTSWRTGDGYAIRAAVPFSELGLTGAGPHEVAFNVLIYDGDKTNAVAGENINKSRLAWAPRNGVQGRPEDWGRLILE